MSLTKHQKNLTRLFSLLLLLLLATVPILAQDTALEQAQSEAVSWRALFLLAFALVFAVVGVVIWLAKKLSEAGDKRADALLEGIRHGLEWIPIKQARSYVQEYREDAKETPSPVDDTIGVVAEFGVDMVEQVQRSIAPATPGSVLPQE